MINTQSNERSKLKKCLKIEGDLYKSYMFPSTSRYLLSRLKYEPARMIWKWQRISRYVDYYDALRKRNWNPWYKLMFFFFICRRNRLAIALGLDMNTANVGPGLQIYHANNVINSFAKIGSNLHLHGSNVIGNKGPGDPKGCPVIGDNVMFGAGAKAIGRITIANNVKIAAGAVVVKDILEPGCTVAGVPASIIKHKGQK